MVRAVLAFVLLLAACLGAAAKQKPFIEITLETREAFLGDTVIVEVRWSGLLDPIDFAPLSENADLLRETSGTRIAVVQGEVIEIASRRIELAPRSIGRLVLGPLVAGDVVSNSVAIDITEARTVDWRPGPDDIRLEQTVSSTQPRLQQQIVLDIVLRTRHPIFDESVVLPDLSAFRVVTLFAERRTLDTTDGGWSKVGWRYLLFPQRSGALTLSGARISGAIDKSRAERGRFDLAAPDTVLAVQPSAFRQGDWWIAATSLSLRDAWSADIRQLSAGDEIDRTITVEAAGVLPEQIPDVVMDDTNGLSIRPTGSKREVRIVGDQALATATFSFHIRATSPISVFVDTIRLRWWETSAGEAREAILPARRIDIGVPERDRLVTDALAEQGVLARMLDAAARHQQAIFIASAIAALALLLAAGGRKRGVSFALWRRRRRLLRQLRRLAHRGDGVGFYRCIRRCQRSEQLQQSLAPAVAVAERLIFSGKEPSKNDLLQALTMVEGLLRLPTRSHTRLPSL